MIFDVIETSLKAPSRIIPVKALFGSSDGARMPHIEPSLLTREMAEAACRLCPTLALSSVRIQDAELLSLDYGKCIGCGRCAELNAFSIAQRLARCGLPRQGLVQYFDFERGKEVFMEPTPQPEAVSSELAPLFVRAVNIRQLDAGSCNGFAAELTALNSPHYDVRISDIPLLPSPHHPTFPLFTVLH